jgi:protein-disulfide isomerase-like protein with CxxC motif
VPLRGPGAAVPQASQFPRSGLRPRRFGGREQWLPEFVRAVYQANFAHDRDITDRAVISKLLQDLGLPVTLWLEPQRTPT